MSAISVLQGAQSSGAMSVLNSSTHTSNSAGSTKAAEMAGSDRLTKTKGSEKASASAVQLKYEFATQAKNKSTEAESDQAYYLTLSEEAQEQLEHIKSES